MLSVSVPPIAMNRFPHECFPHTTSTAKSTATTTDNHDATTAAVVSNEFPRMLMHSNEPPNVLIESKVQPIVRDHNIQLDATGVPSLSLHSNNNNVVDKAQLSQEPSVPKKTVVIIDSSPTLVPPPPPPPAAVAPQSSQQLQQQQPTTNVPHNATPLQEQQHQQHLVPLLLRANASEPTLRRSSSLPSLGQRSISLGQPRRSIFGHYWDKKTLEWNVYNNNRHSLPMVRSMATLPTTGGEWPSTLITPSHPSVLKPTRYVPLFDEASQQQHNQQQHNHHHPLQALANSEGWNPMKIHHRMKPVAPSTMVTMPVTNGGAYPLCSPRSILRRRFLEQQQQLQEQKAEDRRRCRQHHRRDSSESSTELPFALTKSIKQLQRKQQPHHTQLTEDDDIDDDDDLEDDEPTEDSSWCSSTSSSKEKSSSSTSAHIRFNPIVLVTEFEEDPNHSKRQWFTERELSRFQQEAIGKARAYLHSRPKLAEEYNHLKLCPITGAMRKKALFSLPVLSSIVEDVLPKPFSSDFQKLSEREMRNILIVEPNKTVRDLFCRCLHSLFPWARILGAPSGEEAWKVVERGLTTTATAGSELNGFVMDLILVDEKLSRRNASLSPTAAAHHKTPEDGEEACTMTTTTSPSSPVSSHPSTTIMTSYELLRRIHELEDQVCGDQKATDATITTTTTNLPRRPLLIAVTLNLQGAEQLEASGADVVWGIPPPTPCITLRNQLVFALVSKRRFRGDDDTEWI